MIKNLSTISLLPNLVMSLVVISMYEPIVCISFFESCNVAEELTGDNNNKDELMRYTNISLLTVVKLMCRPNNEANN